MKKTISILLVVSVMLSLTYCGVSDSSKVGDDFYQMLKTKDYDKLGALLSDEALAANPKEDWINLFKKLDNAYGTFKSYSRQSFHTGVNGGVHRTELMYEVIYDTDTLYHQMKFIEVGDSYKLSFFRSVSDKSKFDKKK